MDPVVIRNSRWKFGLILTGSLAFVVVGIFILTVDNHPISRATGWMSIVFFGACAAIAVWQLFDSRPRLIIDEHGIIDRTLGVGLIPWAEITDAYVKSIRNNDFICLHVRDPNLWLHKLSPVQKGMVEANKRLGFSELNINLSGISASTQQIQELILKLAASQK